MQIGSEMAALQEKTPKMDPKNDFDVDDISTFYDSISK